MDHIEKLIKHLEDVYETNKIQIADQSFGWGGGDLAVEPWYTADDYEVHVITNSTTDINWETDVYYYEPSFENVIKRIVETVKDVGFDVKIYISDLDKFLPEDEVLEWIEENINETQVKLDKGII